MDDASASGSSKRRVAIIGGGFGGTGAAYYLDKLCDEGVRSTFETTIFERNSYLGGRVTNVSVGGHVTEAGGTGLMESFVHTNELIKTFKLGTKSPFVTQKMITGLWDGAEFVFKANTTNWIQTILVAFETLERYHTAPIKVTKLSKHLEKQFGQVYKKQIDKGKTWGNPADLFDDLGLTKYLSTTASDYLINKEKVNKKYVNELVTGVTRALNGQSPSSINAFSGIVSQVGTTEATFSVKGGNALLCNNMALHSGATVREETVVTKVSRDGSGYQVTYKRLAPMDAFGRYDPSIKTKKVTEHFDVLVIASLFGVTDIEWEGVELPKNITSTPEEQVVHEVWVQGTLDPAYFGVSPKDMVDMVVTMDNPAIPFAAIMLLKKIGGGEGNLYKMFSLGHISDELISQVFLEVYATQHIEWNPAFPVSSPTTSFPDFMVGDNLVYLNGMEQAISSIEVSLIAAYNAAQLLLNEGVLGRKPGKSGDGKKKSEKHHDDSKGKKKVERKSTNDASKKDKKPERKPKHGGKKPEKKESKGKKTTKKGRKK